MDLCKYKNSLGEPGKGFHEDRLGPFAKWDVVGTIVIVLILIIVFGFSPVKTLLTVSVLTVFLHWIFCVPTAGNVMLGL